MSFLSRKLQRMALVNWALRHRHPWPYYVTHCRMLTMGLPSTISLPLICGHYRNALKRPKDLTIALVHNYRKPPIMARSLNYVGIDDYVTFEAKPCQDGWHGTAKAAALHKAIADGKIKTKYLLYCDSSDAMISGDPSELLAYFQSKRCEVLVSKTHYSRGYEAMPDVQNWADGINGGQYMNAGVFMGRTDSIFEILSAMMEYVIDDVTRVETIDFAQATLSDFPRGIGSDQMILRYLQPRFHPRMLVDVEGRLAMRNPSDRFSLPSARAA